MQTETSDDTGMAQSIIDFPNHYCYELVIVL